MVENRHPGLVAPRDRGRLRLRLAIVLVGATVFYLWAWRDGPYLGGDTAGYLAVAEDLEDFHLEELPLRTIGYPLLLRLLGVSSGDEVQVLLVQLALHMVAVLLLAGLLYELQLPNRVILAFAILGVLPPYAQMASFVLSETLCEFLLVVGLVLAVRWLAFEASMLGLAVASLALAMCALTRPLYQLLPFALALVALLSLSFKPMRRHRRRVVIAALVLPCATLLLVGGVGLSNRARFGASASPLLAFALSARLATYIEYADFEREEVEEILVRHRDRALVSTRHHRDEGYIFEAFPELVEAHGGDEAAAVRELIRLNLSVVRREPRSYLRAVTYSLPRFWEPYSTDVAGMRSPFLAAVWIVQQWGVAAAFFALSVIGCALAAWSRTLGDDRLRRLTDSMAPIGSPHFWSLSLFCTAVVYNLGLSVTIGVGVPRYRTPTDLVVLASIAIGLGALDRVQRRLGAGLGERSPERRPVGRAMP